jgi:uncharacterized protein YndB with AHSA1/START domain
VPAPDKLDLTVVIHAPQDLVLKAFFDNDALGAWWSTARSVTIPRVLGPYVVEWQPTDFRDAVFGRLGGVLRGTVMQFDATTGFFLADVFWLPPDSDPVGPMTLEVVCRAVSQPEGNGTHVGNTTVHVRQTGFEDSPRWRHYYELINTGWEQALRSMKMLLER